MTIFIGIIYGLAAAGTTLGLLINENAHPPLWDKLSWMGNARLLLWAVAFGIIWPFTVALGVVVSAE